MTFNELNLKWKVIKIIWEKKILQGTNDSSQFKAY
jgi:hypothetical protein